MMFAFLLRVKADVFLQGDFPAFKKSALKRLAILMVFEEVSVLILLYIY